MACHSGPEHSRTRAQQPSHHGAAATHRPRADPRAIPLRKAGVFLKPNQFLKNVDPLLVFKWAPKGNCSSFKPYLQMCVGFFRSSLLGVA